MEKIYLNRKGKKKKSKCLGSFFLLSLSGYFSSFHMEYKYIRTQHIDRWTNTVWRKRKVSIGIDEEDEARITNVLRLSLRLFCCFFFREIINNRKRNERTSLDPWPTEKQVNAISKQLEMFNLEFPCSRADIVVNEFPVEFLCHLTEVVSVLHLD